jgi:hypothetical protein
VFRRASVAGSGKTSALASSLPASSHLLTHDLRLTLSRHEHCLHKEMRADHEAVAAHDCSDVASLHWAPATQLVGEILPGGDAETTYTERKHNRKKNMPCYTTIFLSPNITGWNQDLKRLADGAPQWLARLHPGRLKGRASCVQHLSTVDYS